MIDFGVALVLLGVLVGMACTVCCGGGTVTCSHCTGSTAAAQWCVTFSGVTNNPAFPTCTGCALLNGTWTLTNYAACSWHVRIPDGICSGVTNQFITLGFDSKYGKWFFDVGSLSGVFNEIATGAFNCVGSNTFTRSTVNPDCLGIASATLTPC